MTARIPLILRNTRGHRPRLQSSRSPQYYANNGYRSIPRDRTNFSNRSADRTDDLSECVPFILERADGRENDAAAAGRCCFGMDYVPVVLPVDAACGIWICACARTLRESSNSDGGA